jgi:hypothetical protein
MSIARGFTERVATAWVSLIATAMVTAGVMLAGMGVTLRQTAFDITGITVITSGLMLMGRRSQSPAPSVGSQTGGFHATLVRRLISPVVACKRWSVLPRRCP